MLQLKLSGLPVFSPRPAYNPTKEVSGVKQCLRHGRPQPMPTPLRHSANR